MKNIIPILLFLFQGSIVLFNVPFSSLLVLLVHLDVNIISQSTYFALILAYIIVIAILWLEKYNFETFNFDRSSLLVLVIVGFVRINLHVPNETQYKAIISALSLALLVLFVMRWENIPKSKAHWAFFGILVCVFVIPVAFVESMQVGKYTNSNHLYEVNFLEYSVRNFLFNFTFVTPFEEIIMQGVLWGQLRKLNLSENKIFWLQGIILWLLHFGQIFTAPTSFFITLPVALLIYSLLVRYSKQVFPSIIAHTLMNTLIPILVMIYSR